MLAGESKTAVEIIDAEAKRARHFPGRHRGAGRLEQVPHARRLREADEARRAPRPAGVLTTRGKYFPLDLARVATAVSTRGDVQLRNRRRRAADLPRLAPQDVRRSAVLTSSIPTATGGRTSCCCTAPAATIPPRMPRDGHAPLPVPRQGDPPFERRRRLGLSDRRKPVRLSMIVRLPLRRRIHGRPRN